MKITELSLALANLRSELEVAENVDKELLEQARRLDIQLHNMVNDNEFEAEALLNEQLLGLEAEFASKHPVLEGLLRDVINKLAQMGI